MGGRQVREHRARTARTGATYAFLYGGAAGGERWPPCAAVLRPGGDGERDRVGRQPRHRGREDDRNLESIKNELLNVLGGCATTGPCGVGARAYEQDKGVA